MTKTVDIQDTEFAGAMKVRIVDVDITNYDDGSNGNGESFTASDAGMHRFQAVQAEVKYEQGGASSVQKCVAQYDWSNNSIRLLQQSDNSAGDADAELVELPQDSDEGVEVRLTCFGR